METLSEDELLTTPVSADLTQTKANNVEDGKWKLNSREVCRLMRCVIQWT